MKCLLISEDTIGMFRRFKAETVSVEEILETKLEEPPFEEVFKGRYGQ